MNDVSVGIIGFGRIGMEHAAWLAEAGGIRAATVADITAARRGMAEERGLRVYTRVEAMLADPAIDAVLVSTPTAMHFEQGMAAMAAGKHVMIEKPMGMNLAEARGLVAEAAKRKVTLGVFQNRRWDVDYLTVKAAIDGGTFGRVINIESRLGQWASCTGPAAKEWHPGWRNEAEFGGGGLNDWGSHFIDQLWQLMLPAKPLRVFAQLRGNVWSRNCDDFARVLIDFDNGAVGMVEINTTTTRPLPRWHIDGTAGSAYSPYSLEFDTDVWASLRFTPAEQNIHRTLPKSPPGLTETQIWECFAAASVLPTMALLDAARRSSQRGEAVEVRQAGN